jgi:hypothetical protein
MDIFNDADRTQVIIKSSYIKLSTILGISLITEQKKSVGMT